MTMSFEPNSKINASLEREQIVSSHDVLSIAWHFSFTIRPFTQNHLKFE